VEKVGDYVFKLEFNKEEEKLRVLEGGPWRHNGDAFILSHYDGLSRLSEIRITGIALSVRLYDLPQVMMKEAVAKQLGSQLGKFIKMDVNFPGYMHVRVEYPLHMALAPELKVKIKGRGVMQITVQYENVSFFCFTCGRMGHAAVNCDQGEPEEQTVRYGEELCASPPQRARVITMRQPDLKVVRSLFQATAQEGISIGARPGRPRWSTEQKEKERVADNAVHAKEEKGNDGMQNGKGFVQGDMVAINKSTEGNAMQVEHDDGEAINPGEITVQKKGYPLAPT
jgi:hypothetical protein